MSPYAIASQSAQRKATSRAASTSIANLRIALILLGSMAIPALGSETDPYTLRDNLKDSSQWLNQHTNAALDASAAKVTSCDAYALQRQLFKEWGGVFYAKIEGWSKENPDARFLPIEQSIYAPVAALRGKHGWRKLTKFGMYYSPGVFRIGDSVIGDDKLGHFFQLGYSMYYAAQKKRNNQFRDIRTLSQKAAEYMVDDYKFIRQSNLQNDELVLAFADFQESTQWGMQATGVKSYADMASNYGGYLFWSRLTEGDHPYFACQNNHWKRVADFDWKVYVNPAWDEAVNCNQYDPRIKSALDIQIQKRGLGSCPIRPDACVDLAHTLGKTANVLLHPDCLHANQMPVAQNEDKSRSGAESSLKENNE